MPHPPILLPLHLLCWWEGQFFNWPSPCQTRPHHSRKVQKLCAPMPPPIPYHCPHTTPSSHTIPHSSIPPSPSYHTIPHPPIPPPPDTMPHPPILLPLHLLCWWEGQFFNWPSPCQTRPHHPRKVQQLCAPIPTPILYHHRHTTHPPPTPIPYTTLTPLPLILYHTHPHQHPYTPSYHTYTTPTHHPYSPRIPYHHPYTPLIPCHTIPYHTIPPPPISPPLPYIPCWWGGQLFWMLFVKFAPPAPTEPSLGYVYPATIVSPPPTHAGYESCVWAYRFVQWPLSRGDRITGQEPRLPGMSCFLGVCWLVASAPPLPPTDDWQTCLPRFQESSNLPHPLPAGPATRCPGTPPWSTARRSRGPPRGAPGRSRPRTTRHYPCRYQKLSNGPCRKGPLRPRLPMRRLHTAGGTRCARGHWAPGRRNSSMTCCNCGLNLASCGSCRVGRRESLPAVSRLPWSR